MTTQPCEITIKDIEQAYYAACSRAVALRQELAAAIAEIDALLKEIGA